MRSGAQVGTLERVHLLRTLPAFSGLRCPDLLLFARRAKEKSFSPGSVLIAPGQSPVVHVIVEGKVRVHRASNDCGVRTGGEGLGLLGLLARTADVRAVAESSTLTLSIDEEDFLDVLEDNFQILHHLLGNLCRARIGQLARQKVGPSLRYSEAWRSIDRPSLHFADRLLFLRRLFPFAQGNVTALVDLARHLKEHHVEAGQPLWQSGDAVGATLLMVVAGELSATLPSGAQMVFGPVTMPGHLEIIAGSCRWFDATAATPLHVFQLDSEMLIDIFDDNEDMALGHLSMVAREVVASRDEHSLEGRAL